MSQFSGKDNLHRAAYFVRAPASYEANDGGAAPPEQLIDGGKLFADERGESLKNRIADLIAEASVQGLQLVDRHDDNKGGSFVLACLGNGFLGPVAGGKTGGAVEGGSRIAATWRMPRRAGTTIQLFGGAIGFGALTFRFKQDAVQTLGKVCSQQMNFPHVHRTQQLASDLPEAADVFGARAGYGGDGGGEQFNLGLQFGGRAPQVFHDLLVMSFQRFYGARPVVQQFGWRRARRERSQSLLRTFTKARRFLRSAFRGVALDACNQLLGQLEQPFFGLTAVLQVSPDGNHSCTRMDDRLGPWIPIGCGDKGFRGSCRSNWAETMRASPDSTCLGIGCNGQHILIRPEGAELRRLTSLIERVFRVPIAYAAMLGHRDRVMSRIGSGDAYWNRLRTFPLGQALRAPVVVRDAHEGLPEGTDLGELRFAATVPLRTPCGQHLGVLVIADRMARPGFSQHDLETLVELASVVSSTIELRTVASRLMESQLLHEEAENRFRYIANCAPTLIACCEADGSCEFVNDAWLRFTGRHTLNELGDGWQRILHHGFRETVLNLYWQALQERQPFTLDVPLRRHDGVFRCARGSGTPRFLQDGTFAGFTLCLTDVSDYSEAAL